MRNLSNDRNAFSIVEIVVATVIFSISTLGVLTAFSLLRQPAKNIDQKLQATYTAQQILEELRYQVDASTWATPLSSLAVGRHPAAGTISGVDGNGKSYTYFYTVTEDATTKARSVILSLTW